jgi:hypothetical protein
MEQHLPHGYSTPFAETAKGLGITSQKFDDIYVFDGAFRSRAKQSRTLARRAVINAIQIVTEDKPLTGIIGLLKVVEFLLTHNRFSYSQGVASRCVYGIFANLSGRGVDYDVSEISNTLGLSMTGEYPNEEDRIFGFAQPDQFKWSHLKTNRARNRRNALRILHFIVTRQ